MDRTNSKIGVIGRTLPLGLAASGGAMAGYAFQADVAICRRCTPTTPLCVAATSRLRRSVARDKRVARMATQRTWSPPSCQHSYTWPASVIPARSATSPLARSGSAAIASNTAVVR
jgi:hypothetical protein